jgi:predicted component of type VI protein secretion system
MIAVSGGFGSRRRVTMRVLLSGLVLSTVVVTAGCGSDAQATTRELELERQLTEVMSGLKELERELELALKARETDSARFELTDFAPEASAPAPQPVRQAQPAPRPAPRPVYNPAPQPQPRVVTQTSVKRDAAIGAGVGAVTGAVVHRRDRVKGAVVGAVVGGAAGAVVGATVNRRTTVVYD